MAQDSGSERPPLRARPGVRIAMVVSRFHAELCTAMRDSARRELLARGVNDQDLFTAWVPGAFELPLVARRYARREDVAAVLCFGLVLKGETTHDMHVARGAIDGIRQVMLETDKPVLLGVLTCDTLAQARARALPPERGGTEDKGREVAQAALEVLEALATAELERPRRSVGFP